MHLEGICSKIGVSVEDAKAYLSKKYPKYDYLEWRSNQIKEGTWGASSKCVTRQATAEELAELDKGKLAKELSRQELARQIKVGDISSKKTILHEPVDGEEEYNYSLNSLKQMLESTKASFEECPSDSCVPLRAAKDLGEVLANLPW